MRYFAMAVVIPLECFIGYEVLVRLHDWYVILEALAGK